METSSLKRFESDLFEVRKEFPNLQIKEWKGQKYLKGILDLKTGNETIVKSYLIEIKYAAGYPYRFPVLYEIGGDIPNVSDFHKYDDGSCCITVQPDEILTCQHGLSITKFIKHEVLPYFGNQYYRKITGEYKKDYPHGRMGYLVYFIDFFGTDNRYQWLQLLQSAFENKTLKIHKTDLCYCGSGKSFGQCHVNVIAKLQILGKHKVIEYLKIL